MAIMVVTTVHNLVNGMTFPRTGAPLWTDVQFNEMQDDKPHLGPSPFQRLPIGMVSQFPNDYVSGIYQGIVKRMK